MTKNEKVIGIVGVLLTLAIALYALVGSNQSVPVDEIVSKVVSQLSSKVPDILGAVGTRFPNGVSVGGQVSPSAGQFLAQSTSTQTTLSGVYAYQKKGVYGNERQYAYGSFAFTSTSSSPVIMPNPFNSSTTPISLTCQGDGLAGSANTFDISTTTSSGGNGSSTPALVRAYSVGSGNQFSMIWRPNSATTSTGIAGAGINILPGANLDGSSNYIWKSNENLVLRWATSSPATLGAYPSANCYLEATKL